MSLILLMIAAIPPFLAAALAVWLVVRILRSRTPARVEARIRDRERR